MFHRHCSMMGVAYMVSKWERPTNQRTHQRADQLTNLPTNHLTHHPSSNKTLAMAPRFPEISGASLWEELPNLVPVHIVQPQKRDHWKRNVHVLRSGLGRMFGKMFGRAVDNSVGE